MRKTMKFYHSINIRIIIILIILFAFVILAVSAVNYQNLHTIYEKNFTNQVLLCNSLIAQVIDSEDVEHYVNMLTEQDESFKKKQVQYFYDREMLFRPLDEKWGADERAGILMRMKNFRDEMGALKSSK